MTERHLLDGRSDAADAPPHDTETSWLVATHGPVPRPAWVVTDVAARDVELGVLKTGKEADVHLVERFVPGTATATLMAAKRYRTAEHRQFHRDAGYTEGRRVRRSRETRAMARRTEFGRELLAGQWSAAEFEALSRLWAAGAPVPYPVQVLGTELLLEFIGDDDGRAAPRLAGWRGTPQQARALWEQLRDAMTLLAREGWAHGDLSPYNLLVHGDRLVMIDLPQVVDVVANPAGMEFLARDCRNVAGWFARHGVDVDVDLLIGDLAADAFGA